VNDDLSPTGFYKILDTNLSPYHGGKGKWIVGKRRSVRGELVPCQNGIHVVTLTQIWDWLGPALHPVTAVSDERIDAGDKTVCRWATIGPALTTWNERTMRLFACDCAERALLRERERGREPDQRSWNSITVARRFANGGASRQELDAARASAGDAAWASAGDAAWAAAWAATGATTGAAAWAATGDAAERLLTYLRGETPAPVTLDVGVAL
jgi:hypothetical protein